MSRSVNVPSVAKPNLTVPTSSLPGQNQYSTGYTSVQYDNVYGGVDTQQFYGMLIDASNHPSEMLCRLADALFFHVDKNCPQFRGTQHIEPAKYAWLSRALGVDGAGAAVLEQKVRGLYDAGSIPYDMVTVNGAQIAVVNRRGWLHLAVFEALAEPEASAKAWTKVINSLALRDPANNEPFPTPVPRSAFPLLADWSLHQKFVNWQAQVAVASSQQQVQLAVASSQQQMQAILAPLQQQTQAAATSSQQQTLAMMQQMQAKQQRANMIRAGVSIVSSLMGEPAGIGGS